MKKNTIRCAGKKFKSYENPSVTRAGHGVADDQEPYGISDLRTTCTQQNKLRRHIPHVEVALLGTIVLSALAHHRIAMHALLGEGAIRAVLSIARLWGAAAHQDPALQEPAQRAQVLAQRLCSHQVLWQQKALTLPGLSAHLSLIAVFSMLVAYITDMVGQMRNDGAGAEQQHHSTDVYKHCRGMQ